MLKEAITTFLDILYPKSCHICSKIFKNRTEAFDDYLCLECFKGMKKTSVIYETLWEKERNISVYHRLISYYVYEGSIKELVHKFKYSNRPYLAGTIAALMSSRIKEYDMPLLNRIDALLPVPLHPSRQREREFNQSELIARNLSLEYKKPVCLAVKRNRPTKPQTTLDRTQRHSNVRGAFCLAKNASVEGKHILIIEDVVTTTATVREILRALRKAGAKNASVLAFARG